MWWLMLAVQTPAIDAVVDTPPAAPSNQVQADAEAPTSPIIEEGLASYYAARFAGRRTASGERYNPKKATCAHRTHPFGTRLRITVERTGKSSVCVVNDRGPHRKHRIIDVSQKVARELGLLGAGLRSVRIHVEPDATANTNEADPHQGE
jgi:rare lipoprotein A